MLKHFFEKYNYWFDYEDIFDYLKELDINQKKEFRELLFKLKNEKIIIETNFMNINNFINDYRYNQIEKIKMDHFIIDDPLFIVDIKKLRENYENF